MSRMANLEIELKNIIEEYKKNHEPISIAVADIASRYQLSRAYVYLLIDQLLHEESDGGMTFQDEYTRRRFEGR